MTGKYIRQLRRIACSVCGVERESGAHNAKYCSRRCRVQAWRNRSGQCWLHHVPEETKKRRAALYHKHGRINNLKKYGITEAQYQKMLQMGNGGCWVCGKVPGVRALAVDHDHGPSKRVRGLACFHCNRYRIAWNTIATARKVLAYLESDFDGRKL